jgi:hypothetical protein
MVFEQGLLGRCVSHIMRMADRIPLKYKIVNCLHLGVLLTYDQMCDQRVDRGVRARTDGQLLLVLPKYMTGGGLERSDPAINPGMKHQKENGRSRRVQKRSNCISTDVGARRCPVRPREVARVFLHLFISLSYYSWCGASRKTLSIT